MGLFGPVWMSANKKKVDQAIAYIRTVTDQETLKKIAMKAPLERVAAEAVFRITDSRIFLELGKKAPLPYVRACAIRSIDNPDLLVEFTKDDTLDELFRLDIIKKLSEQQKDFSLAPYKELVERVLKNDTSVGHSFREAVDLCDNLDLLENIYEKHSHEWAVSRQKDSQHLRARASQLAEEFLNGEPEEAILFHLIDNKVFSPTVKEKAQAILISLISGRASQKEIFDIVCKYSQLRKKVLPLLTDEHLLFTFITTYSVIGNESYLDAVERINDKNSLKDIARNECLNPSARIKAAMLANLDTPSISRLTVCKFCGKPVYYAEWFEKTSNESWNTVRKTYCSGECWSVDGELFSASNNWEVKDVTPETIYNLVFICPSCGGIRDYTTDREPSIRKCNCGSIITPHPVRASLAPW